MEQQVGKMVKRLVFIEHFLYSLIVNNFAFDKKVKGQSHWLHQ